jgi:hypothetical protein
VLSRLHELAEAEAELQQHRATLAAAESAIKSVAAAAQQHKK